MNSNIIAESRWSNHRLNTSVSSTVPIASTGESSHNNGKFASWQKFFVCGVPLLMILMSAGMVRVVKAGEHSRLPPRTAMNLYGRPKQAIAREYGDPIRLDRAGKTWYRYTKGQTIVMARYDEDDTADRIVVSDLAADPGVEGDAQRYPLKGG